MSNYSFRELTDLQVSLLKEARNLLVSSLEKKTELLDLEIKNNSRSGCGIESSTNDRRMYVWIECRYKGKEYNITLFQSEIDPNSGNAHTQIGKVMFVKGYVQNKRTPTSPNVILSRINMKKGGKTEYLSDENQTLLMFNSYKWENPLNYFENMEKERLSNGKWITVDDVFQEGFADEITDAFIKFMKQARQNVPITYLEYAALNGFTDEMWDSTAEKYYNKLASLLNRISVMSQEEMDRLTGPDEDITEFELDEMMDFYVKNNRVSAEVAEQLIRLMEDEIYQLGAEYGFLEDIILELFYEN